eukprot:5296709-Pleurochrysis_carterae.AAC.4
MLAGALEAQQQGQACIAAATARPRTSKRERTSPTPRRAVSPCASSSRPQHTRDTRVVKQLRRGGARSRDAAARCMLRTQTLQPGPVALATQPCATLPLCKPHRTSPAKQPELLVGPAPFAS